MARLDESPIAINQERQEQSIIAQDKALADRDHLLDLAGAQLAILLAHDEQADSPSLESRLVGHTGSNVRNAGEDLGAVLTDAEKEELPGAKFVVNSIFKAAKMEIPKTYLVKQRQRTLRGLGRVPRAT